MEEGIKQLIDMVANLKMTMEEKFDEIDKRFDEIDKRFDGVDKRFDGVDKRFEDVDKRFEDVDKRFEGIELRLDNIEGKIDILNDNQHKIIKTIRVMKDDIDNNRRHIDKIENEDEYYPLND